MEKEKRNPRLSIIEISLHMAMGGKVKVKDKHDGQYKKSSITAVYSDRTVTLCDTVHSDYKISELKLIPEINPNGLVTVKQMRFNAKKYRMLEAISKNLFNEIGI
jgi:hypothetical protein